ncbi:MAG: PAS domain S-box protein [Myxococcales bacterium]|nr:PAS domain S-box protein [Myxococcales bacterium]
MCGLLYGLVLLSAGLPLAWPAPVAAASFLAGLALLYGRQLRGAAYVASGGLTLTSVAATVLAGGPSAFGALVPNLLIALAIAISVSSRRQMVALTVAATTAVAGLWWLERSGWLVAGSGHQPDAPAYAVLAVAAGGGFLTTAVHAFRTALTDRERTEQHLRELLDEMPDGLVSLDQDGTITSCNPAAARITGRPVSEVVGRHFTTVLRHDDDEAVVQEFRAQVDGSGPPLARRVVQRRDGTEVTVELNTSVVQRGEARELRLVIRDLTERLQQERRREELETQLLEARRLEAIGRLAGGVAHDFNNLLTVIVSSASLLDDEENLSDDGRSLLTELSAAATRAGQLTGQLLAFARRQVREPRVVDLSSVVAAAGSLMRRLVRENIQLGLVPGAELTIFADPLQLEQILVNLVVNARDAMPDGGTVTVETQRTELGDDYAMRKAGVQPGTYALLAVTDTGQGMDTDTITHVFEPFFTTKGKLGTGLGLATVHGIVKQSGGHVFVYSEIGKGTTFKVYFPVTDRPLPAAEVPQAGRVVEAPRQGTILVVDDDPAVLATTARVLKSAGYEVLAAHGPEEAVALSQIHRGGIDLLVTDVVMPKMGGVDLAERLTVGRPGLKVLFASGYTENAIVHHGVLEPGIHFIAKPFTPAALRARVDQVLGRE